MAQKPHKIDYDNIPIPSNKPRSDYKYSERRAAILRFIEKAGHPRALNMAQLAREFDVSHTTIRNDMDILREYVSENIDREHEFVMDRVLQGAMRNLVDDGEHYKAAKVASMWYQWMADIGEAPRVPQGVNVDATVREAARSTDDYVLVTDDTAIEMDQAPPDADALPDTDAIRTEDNPGGNALGDGDGTGVDANGDGGGGNA